MQIKPKWFPLFAPAGEESAALDRGDNFVADDDELDDAPSDTQPNDKLTDDDVDAAGTPAKDADDDGEGEGEGGEKPAKPKIRIPKERLDQEIQKRRNAEQRAAERINELERELASRTSSADIAQLEQDVAALDDQYDEAIADGERGKAKEIKAQIRVLERQIQRAETGLAAANAKVAAVAELKYDMALSQVELDYPALNPDSAEFDRDATAEVAELIDSFKLKGMDPSAALRKAVKYVLGAPTKAAEDNRNVERDGLREAKASEARRKAADAIARTPANLAKSGKDSDTAGGALPDARAVAKMSQDEFSKLDDTMKARLRGDDI
jgi:hypothetical protein